MGTFTPEYEIEWRRGGLVISVLDFKFDVGGSSLVYAVLLFP